MASPLRRLAALDARSLFDLFLAQWALLRAQRRLRREPVGSLTIRSSEPASPASGDIERARALARAINRAAAFGVIRPHCLARALALTELLERAEVRGSEIRVGVRRTNGAFSAHAWVRLGEELLGEQPEHVASFTEVDDIRVLGTR
jgi:hypothetical protein